MVDARVADTIAWHDFRVKLPELSEGGATIVLTAAGAAGDVVFWSNPLVRGPRKRPFNVIMVLEDALRADHLSAYGYHRKTTPFKDRFFERGAVFSRCIAQAPITRPSCPSIMTSLYPSAAGVWNFQQKLAPEYLTLAEVMRSRGFVTGAIVQNHNAGPEAGLHQGFSFMWMDTDEPSSAVCRTLAAPWIEQHRDRNFFLYLHLFDPHAPYEARAGFRQFLDEEVPDGEAVERDPMYDPEWVQRPTSASRRALYDGEIRGNDEDLGGLVDHLEQLGLLEDTLLIFLADHGEFLGEHDMWGHQAPGFVEVLHVPLTFIYPRRIAAGRKVDSLVQNLDIMPTILELAGIDSRDLLLQGDSLVPLIDRGDPGVWERAVYSEERLSRSGRLSLQPFASVFTAGLHLLSTPDLPVQVFARASDSHEGHGTVLDEERRNALIEGMHSVQSHNLSIWEALTAGRSDDVHVDPAAAEALRALGYLDVHE